MPAYKDEKTKKWYVKFRYIDWQGKSKQTTKRGFQTKKDALNYEHDFKATSKDHIDITVDSLAEKYIEDRKLYVKYNTFLSMQQLIKNHILPYLSKLKLDELTPIVMRNWQNQITQKNFKPSTVIQIHRCCSSLLNFAVKFYGLKQNPLHIVGSIGKRESRVDFWELSEFNKFINEVDNPKHKLCFLILFYSGMRVGELLALNLEDFDFQDNKISITKNKVEKNGEITPPKTKYSIRKIDMPAGIMQAVKEYIDTLDEITSPLFTMSQNNLLDSIHKYAKKANVREIRIHDLRHSHASLLIHCGVPITTISKRLGHQSPKITLEVYSHMYNESGEQTAKKLQEIFVGQSVVNG